MSDTPESCQDDRGSARLRPSKQQAQISGLGLDLIPAVVLDESFGGIGVAVSIVPEVGMELEVQLEDVRAWAIIRHVTLLPSGSRVGLEWKAQALSRKLRQLIDTTAVDVTPTKEARFGKILPGGLSMLWKLFEARHWHHLRDSAERLRKEAAGCGVTALTAHVERLIEAIDLYLLASNTDPLPDKTTEIATIERTLNRLIDKCVRVILEQSHSAAPL